VNRRAVCTRSEEEICRTSAPLGVVPSLGWSVVDPPSLGTASRAIGLLEQEGQYLPGCSATRRVVVAWNRGCIAEDIGTVEEAMASAQGDSRLPGPATGGGLNGSFWESGGDTVRAGGTVEEAMALHRQSRSSSFRRPRRPRGLSPLLAPNPNIHLAGERLRMPLSARCPKDPADFSLSFAFSRTQHCAKQLDTLTTF